jgi:hypothetical protein
MNPLSESPRLRVPACRFRDSRALRTDPVKQLNDDGVPTLWKSGAELDTPCFNKAPPEDHGPAAIAAGRHLSSLSFNYTATTCPFALQREKTKGERAGVSYLDVNRVVVLPHVKAVAHRLDQLVKARVL